MKKNYIIASVIIAGLAIVALLYVAKTRDKGTSLQDLKVREIVGDTVEERLQARQIDVTNAVITEITDVEALRAKFSALVQNAENGHYIVELPDKILIYDFEHDEIIHEFQFQRIDLGERQS